MDKEDIKEAKEEVGKYAELEGVANSVGGKKLILSLQNDIKGSIEGLCSKYRELPHIELIALLARLDERLKLLQTLETSSKKKKSAKERLNELMKVLGEQT